MCGFSLFRLLVKKSDEKQFATHFEFLVFIGGWGASIEIVEDLEEPLFLGLGVHLEVHVHEDLTS